jgi:hypothetical protein
MVRSRSSFNFDESTTGIAAKDRHSTCNVTYVEPRSATMMRTATKTTPARSRITAMAWKGVRERDGRECGVGCEVVWCCVAYA